jgi:hypothetical protein
MLQKWQHYYMGCWGNQQWGHKIDVNSPNINLKAKSLNPGPPRGFRRKDDSNKSDRQWQTLQLIVNMEVITAIKFSIEALWLFLT